MTTRRHQGPTYCEGPLHVKLSENSDYRKYFAQLRGQELHLYKEDKKTFGSGAHIEEVVALANVKSITKNSKRVTRQPSFPTISIEYNPNCAWVEVRIRALNAKEQDNWFRYLQAVALHKLPDDASQLLPGQMRDLEDIVSHYKSEPNYMIMDPTPLPPPPERSTSLAQSGQWNAPFKVLPPAPQNPGLQPPKPTPKPRFPTQLTPSTTSPTVPPKPPGSVGTLPREKSLGSMVNSLVLNQENLIKQRSVEVQPPQVPKSPDQRAALKPPSPAEKKNLEIPPTRPDQLPGPSWFFDYVMEREEAETILNNNTDYGNMILRRRPTGQNDPWTHAVSIKPKDNQPYKHFRVRKNSDGSGRTEYEINLSEKTQPPPLRSLEEVVQYFTRKSSGAFVPLSTINESPVSSQHVYDQAMPDRSRPRLQSADPVPTVPERTYFNEGGNGYYNVTEDMRNLSSTLPAPGRHGNRPPAIRRQTSPALSGVPQLPQEPGYRM